MLYFSRTEAQRKGVSMDNIMRIVQTGVCTGCQACAFCGHISFVKNTLGFYAPVVDDQCTHCGQCVAACIYDLNRQADEDE